jgi:hypothetical protein
LTVHIQAIRANDDALETKKYNGRDHLVVPSVILVEGVLHSSNSDHPALALAEEFGKAPQGWNGRPIMFDHPKVDGEPVSANSPDIWEGQVIGQLFGTMVKNSTKLKTDLWLDTERTPTEVFDALDAGDSLEVSTGLYAQEESSKGVFNGKEYDTIWRNIVPDHLAVLPKGHVGACSIQDGCGAPRANQERIYSMQPPKGLSQPKGPRNDSAVPPKQCASGSGSCECGATDPKGANPAQNATKEVLVVANMTKILSNFLISIGLKTQELSDKDKATALEAALSQAEEGEPFYILAIFSDKVIYACLNTADYSWHTYSRPYSVAEGGAVTLGAESGEVRPETQYVPLVVAINDSGPPEQPPKGNETMTPAQTPEQIAEAARIAGAVTAPPVVASGTALPGVGVATPASIPAVAPVKATSLEALAEHADEATKKQLEALLKDQKDRKEALVKALEGKTGLDTAQHQAMSISALESMAKKLAPGTAPQIDFSGAAGAPPAPNANGDKDPGFVAAEQVFPIKDGRVEMPAAAGKH